MLVRNPRGTAVDFAEPPEGRSVSVDIGPFADQADLLHFAMLLETVPGIGHIDLIDAEPETALFVVRARAAAEVAELLEQLPGYAITSTIFGNMVSAQIQDSRSRAAVVFTPSAIPATPRGTYTEPIYVEAARPHWWRRAALAAAVGASAAGILFVALNGVPRWQASPTAPPRPTVAAAIPTAFVPPRSTSTLAVVPTVAPAVAGTASPSATPAPAAAVPSATAAPTAALTVAPTASPTASPTAAPVLTSRYAGSFSTSLGAIRALNACVWDTPLDGTLALNLTRAADGSVFGEATMSGVMSYVVAERPAGATCNPSEVRLEAGGSASGGNSVQASLSGARDLVVTFNGAVQGSEVVGDLSISRAMSTVSSFGNTSETRSASVFGLALSRSN